METQNELDRMLAEVEQREAAEAAKQVNDALNELDSHIIMLRGMGVKVSVTLDAPTTRPLDKIEQPGSTKRPGWYIYCNMLDEEDTKRRIDAARQAAEYAGRE